MRHPGRDSLKYPVVLVEFAPPGNRSTTNQTNAFTIVPNRLTSKVAFGDEIYGVVPGFFYVKSLHVKRLVGSAAQVTIQMFDPDFDNILTRLAAINNGGMRFGQVYVRYGWISGSSDGEPMLSSNGSFVLTEVNTNVTPDGTELEISGIDRGMYAIASVQVDGVAVKCGGLPGHEVIRQVLQGNYGYDTRWKPPKVEVECPLAPIEFHGASDYLIMQNTTPWAFCKQLVTGIDIDGNPTTNTPRLRPADPSVADRSIELVPEVDESGLSIVRISLSSPSMKAKSVRAYTFGRGVDGNVVSLRLVDNTTISAFLGLSGPTQAVLANGSYVSQEAPADASIGPAGPGPRLFAQPTAAGNIQTLDSRRKAIWANAKRIALTAEMTVVGDPTLRVLDVIRVGVLRGGTLSNLGGYVDSNDTRNPADVDEIPGLSNVYVITEIEHTIEAGSFTTNLKLIRHSEPSVGELQAINSFKAKAREQAAREQAAQEELDNEPLVLRMHSDI